MRKLVLSVCVVYLVAVSVMGVALHSAKPGPSEQAIQGVGIGNYTASDGIAYLSGRRLGCAPLPAGDEFAERCTINIANKPLEIRARRNGPESLNQLGGICAASYDGHEWPCEMGLRHVQVPWFVFISPQMNLTSSQMDALRQQYWIENLPEDSFLNLMLVLTIVTTLLGLMVVSVLVGPRVQRKSLTVLIAVFTNLMLLPATCMLSLWVTAGFWD